jgi:hypothetical protein
MGVRALGLLVALPFRLRMVRVRRPVTSMGNQFETHASAEHGLIQNELSQAFTSCLHKLAISWKLAQNCLDPTC